MEKIDIEPNVLSEIIRDYTSGLSAQKIVNKYNNKYGEWTIRRRLEESGVKIRDRAVFSKKYELDINFFDKIDTEEKAYWLGMMFADGSIYSSKKGKMFHLTLQARDRGHIEKFKTALKTNAPIHHQKRKNHYGLFIWSKYLYDSLEKLGCIRRKGAYIRFPSRNILPEEFSRHFIRGYFDGNGCITWNKKNYRIAIRIISNVDFLNDLREVFTEKLGIKTYYEAEKIEYQDYPGKFYTNLDFGTYQGVTNFYHFMYDNSTVFLDRKKESFEKFITESNDK